jgi:hypothetical protein
VASIFQQAKDLEAQVGGILSAFDVEDLPMQQKELVIQLKHQLVDARIDARDYEYAETRDDQLRVAQESHERLALLKQTILKASEHNVFSAVDIAQLSARIEQIISQMD